MSLNLLKPQPPSKLTNKNCFKRNDLQENLKNFHANKENYGNSLPLSFSTVSNSLQSVILSDIVKFV